MFDVGFWELIILFGLGLVILGPERLPKVAMQVGNWAGQARRMARTLTSQMRDELDIDVNKPFSGTPPKPPNYSRPGMDDLKPGTDDDTDTQDVDEKSDDRDHTDAGTPEPDDKRSHADTGKDT